MWEPAKGLFSLCTFDQVLDSNGGWNYGLLSKKVAVCAPACVSAGAAQAGQLSFRGLTVFGLAAPHTTT